MLSNNTTLAADLQEGDILRDVSTSGKVRPWRQHKQESLLLANIYDYAGDYGSKAARIRTCAEWAEFTKSEQAMKLHSAYFCRARLCPMCQWRRSLKLAGQTRAIVAEANRRRVAEKGKPYAWLMLTLTQKNVDGCDLGRELSIIQSGASLMFRRDKDIKAAVVGWLRMTEVTHNTQYGGMQFDSFHPHLHLLLCVNPSYFKSKSYIPREKWAEKWAKYAKLDYTPEVYITRVKADDPGLIAEVSKYATKPADYIIGWDLDLAANTVQILEHECAGRRFAAYGGILKEIHRALSLDDADTGDLVHVEAEAEAADQTAAALENLILYRWRAGINNYYREG